MAAPQVVIMGRRTYEALAGYPDESRMTQLDKVVFSRTLQQVVWPNTRICGEDLVDEIRRMKAGSGVPLRTMGAFPRPGSS